MISENWFVVRGKSGNLFCPDEWQSGLAKCQSLCFFPVIRHELGRYPAKDYATYWECKEYPKAWGHGSKENPLPPNSVPREKGPLRDRIWFREPTTIPRLPKSLEPVLNK